jgi:meso-butanediol dehydrogenase / (S,S)-butanediol dehydrogenase / diacetyl reductase
VAMQGKTVIVTGAAMGIGRFIASTFANDGADVVIADIEDQGLDSVAGELSALGGGVLAQKTDVRDEDQVGRLVNDTIQRFGRIDALVNNAGIVPHFQWGGTRWPAIRDLDKAFWDKVLDTNLGGTMLCTKHVLPHMEQQGSGHVVNLYGGGRGTGASPYVVSKEAIRYFTAYVAEEERERNVCVVVLSPGAAIATERAPEEARQRMPGPDLAGNRFVLAAQAPMEMSGHLLDLKDDHLEIVSR